MKTESIQPLIQMLYELGKKALLRDNFIQSPPIQAFFKELCGPDSEKHIRKISESPINFADLADIIHMKFITKNFGNDIKVAKENVLKVGKEMLGRKKIDKMLDYRVRKYIK